MKRRNFISTAILGSASLAGGASILNSCSTGDSSSQKNVKLLSYEELNLPTLLDKAPEGKALRFGLIGCGGRGSGAAVNLLGAGDGLSIVAIADCLPDRLESCRKLLNGKGQDIAPEQAYLGFDAYRKVLESNIDAVIIAVPSRFHPAMFDAAIEAGKHVFIEKPCAVDSTGARKFLVTAKRADEKKLSVVCGTQRRHGKEYCATYQQVASGLIGEILGGSCYWMTARTWFVKRKPEWTDAEYILRNWLNYPFMGGDVIVDHHIHNLDVVSWFMGNKVPVKACGFGAKVHPSAGNKYDIFSVHYEFENGAVIASGTRHIDGCSGNVGEYLIGQYGKTNCQDKIWDLQGNLIWEYPYEKDEKGKNIPVTDHYVQEHIDWVTSIRTGKPVNEANNMARSTLMAIMGRNSAYTGKTITWDGIMANTDVLGPDIDAMGKVDYSDIHPLPGKASQAHDS
ncbi:MAG: Gfo/Idh/MocA family oxidoreductase [Prevotellaceae bacterium]|jgi:predicted dehydrogenase|nr:Gfo/Idh/MocA family oxidoreductase [Prevotellaceae bacterium]